jgi:stage V sporulation protein S
VVNVHVANVRATHDPARITFFSDQDDLIKVAATSPPHDMAYAIVRSIQNGRHPVMRALGHGAVGQAVKAQVIARGLAAPLGIDLLYLPAFDNILGQEGKELSVIVWRVLWR